MHNMTWACVGLAAGWLAKTMTPAVPAAPHPQPAVTSAHTARIAAHAAGDTPPNSTIIAAAANRHPSTYGTSIAAPAARGRPTHTDLIAEDTTHDAAGGQVTATTAGRRSGTTGVPDAEQQQWPGWQSEHQQVASFRPRAKRWSGSSSTSVTGHTRRSHRPPQA